MDTLIGGHPPYDGNQWDNQCARCGSSLDWQECSNCGGEGVSGQDCGEDCCCCRDPADNIGCDICGGEGGWFTCFSSKDWCKDNPLDGREEVKSGTPEWFIIEHRKKA